MNMDFKSDENSQIVTKGIYVQITVTVYSHNFIKHLNFH
jgi:hypothetical protein